MSTKVSKLKGRVLDVAYRESLQDSINQDGLDGVAGDTGVSPITLAKAASGYPVGAATILDLREYLEDPEADDVEDDDIDEDAEDDEDEDEDEGD